jgi:putative tryptophan/tyrosine transport system substrate-binding protein
MRRRELITLLGTAAVLAVRGASAAGTEAGNRWIARLGHSGGTEHMDYRICAENARTGLDRGPQSYDRVSLGRRTHRAFGRARKRARSAESRCHPYPQHSTTACSKAGDIGHPIVFATAGDPVGSGIVASLARPGGNVTGLSSQTPDAAGKKLELLREVVPGLHRLATLADVNNPYATLDVSKIKESARALRIEVASFEIQRGEQLDSTFEMLKGQTDALYVLPVPLLFTNRVRINTLALSARLPTLHGVREYVEAGGLMSYGPNWPSMWRRAADLVDKILRGAKTADIPVEQPTKFDLIINLTTAKALGLTIPNKILAIANEVIE